MDGNVKIIFNLIMETLKKSICLNSNKIQDMFGDDWKNNPLKVSLELVASDKDSKDLVWIIIVNNDYFLSIKYHEDGIVIDRYDKSGGIEGVCRACFPNSQRITYNTHSTDKLLKDILQKLDEMKTKWKGTYQAYKMGENVGINKPKFQDSDPIKFSLEFGEFLLNKKLPIGTKLEKNRKLN